METLNILSMNHGEGEFSYANNCTTVQGSLFTHKIKPIVENSIQYQLFHNTSKPCKVLNVVDFGCGIGPTPIALITTVIDIAHKVCKELKKENNDDEVLEAVQIYMSDLPSNDFNKLFKDAAKIQGPKQDGTPLCFVMAAPGSFHGRLFPARSLHFVHSCGGIHWLSQVPLGVYNKEGMPMNKGTIAATEASNPKVLESYLGQFKQDFTSFLSCRSQEIVTNGHMVLAFPGRPSIKPDKQLLMSLLYQALASLVPTGVITEEKLDSFNMPLYFPCKEEVEVIISKEGSFAIENMEMTIDESAKEIKDNGLKAEGLTKFLRSATETLFSYHFGSDLWNVLHSVLHQVILGYLDSNKDNPIQTFLFVMLLSKK